MANINKNLKEKLNKISINTGRYEIEGKECYAYLHELVYYGIEAIAHIELMKKAIEISKNKISIEDFFKKYKIDFERINGNVINNGFIGSLRSIENEGIFIPTHAYFNKEDRKIYFFSADYKNRIYTWPENKLSLIELANKKWNFSKDFNDIALVEQGLIFGKCIWESCIKGFEKYQKGVKEYSIQKQPKNITNLGKRLIKYYNSVISE